MGFKTQYINFMSPASMPFRLNGKNLCEFRRAKLRIMAMGLELSPDGMKNDLLIRISDKLRMMDAPAELTELKGFEDQAEKTP